MWDKKDSCNTQPARIPTVKKLNKLIGTPSSVRLDYISVDLNSDFYCPLKSSPFFIERN